jgi:hypothetical protein
MDSVFEHCYGKTLGCVATGKGLCKWWGNAYGLCSRNQRRLLAATILLYCAVKYRAAWGTWIKRWVSIRARRYFSTIVEQGMHHPNIQATQLRNEFRRTLLPDLRGDDPGHSHPDSAVWRSSATLLGRTMGGRLGTPIFTFQSGSADVRDGLRGSRSYYWAKDVAVPVSHATPRGGDLLAVVDVDYYVDMPQLLASCDNPVLLYTFQPTAVAESNGEFTFSFDESNHVTYNVAGGASYKHQVWNYGVDHITVSTWWATKVYVVERRKANPHHTYVLLVPVGTWYGVFAWLARLLGSTPLSRLEVNFGEFNVLDVKTLDGHVRSIGRVNELNVATVPTKTMESFLAISRHSKLPIGLATVQGWLDGDKHASSVIVDYIRSGHCGRPPLVYDAADGIKPYQILQKRGDYQAEASTYVTSFMSPILPRAYVPTKTYTNDVAAVAGRVIGPAKDAKMLQHGMTKFLIMCMEEFVEQLQPVAHKLHPVEVSDVYDQQNRPTQRVLLEQAEADHYVHEVNNFLKAEPYQKAADPRIITTYHTVNKREYARYIYPLAADLGQSKTGFWYSFGRSPADIAENIATMATMEKLGLNLADASRMDGHICEPSRHLELLWLLRSFAICYHEEIRELHAAQRGAWARTKLGVRYQMGEQRGSGSLETALFNSLTTKAISYTARRLAGWTPEEAFWAAGQFGGDDAIESSIGRHEIGGHYLVRAGAMFGQRLEVEEKPRYAPGVNYLSRYFTDEVWNGNPASTCDLGRMLSKLHVTVNLTNFTPIQKLQQKLTGLSYTDRKTPILDVLIKKADELGLLLGQADLDVRIASWWVKYGQERNWPNEEPRDPSEFVSRLVGDVDVTSYVDYVNNVVDACELLRLPAIAVRDTGENVKQLTVIDGVEYSPQQEEKHASPDPPHKGLCKRFIEGRCKDLHCRFEHKQVCREYARARSCKYGERCKFPHV